MNLIGKTVKLDLVGKDGNAFALLGAFSSAARRQGWSAEEISKVRSAATSGDYDNLLQVLMDHTEEEQSGDDEDDDEDES